MSANAFRDFLTYHVAADRTLVVDLSELEFMGTCGLSVLSVLSTRSRDVGGTLALVCARPVQRLLKAAGQESMFACYESLDHAIGLEETRPSFVKFSFVEPVSVSALHFGECPCVGGLSAVL